jgi:hypothetical protein
MFHESKGISFEDGGYATWNRTLPASFLSNFINLINTRRRVEKNV